MTSTQTDSILGYLAVSLPVLRIVERVLEAIGGSMKVAQQYILAAELSVIGLIVAVNQHVIAGVGLYCIGLLAIF